MSTSLTWTGSANTDIDNEQNWSPAETPTSSDILNFNEAITNGGTLTGSASALQFLFGGLYPWVLNGATLTAAGQSGTPFPFAGSFSANVTLNSAKLNAAGGTTFIGSTLGATVTAESGSTVTTEGDNVGEDAGQSGSLVLAGNGTTWTEQESGGSGGFLTVGLEGPSGSLGGSTGFLSVTNNASLITQGSATFGQDSGSQGFGTLASGGVWSTTGLVVGQDGAGTLTINSGGTLLNGGTFSAIGQDAGSTGELVIEAGGTYASTLASQSNGFVLDIGDNGASGTLAAASGTALVTGTDATLNLNGNPLAVGLNGGTGSLTVSSGGTVEVGTANSNNNSALSIGKLGTGIVTVTGTGSGLTTAGSANIGRGGSGTLVVENDAVVQIGTDQSGSGGLSIGTGSTSAGQPIGGTGTAIVNSGGSLYSAENINVGGVGVSGELDIDAGTVEAGTRVLVGDAAVVSGTTEVGSGVVNIGPGGTLDIQGNGITAAGTSALTIAGYNGTTVADGGSGTVDVVGSDAVLNAGSNYIVVGSHGSAEMTVAQGGSVLTGQQFSSDVAVVLGADAAAQGLLTVADAGSVLQAQGQIDVGADGSGALVIENDGRVISGNNPVFARGGLVIGWGSGSSGEVTVTGTGSTLNNTGQFEVGGSGNVNSGTAQTGGTGTLLIEAGGTVVTNLPSSGYTGPAADIAADPGTDGSSVTVTGTGSDWNIGGSLVVGDLAAGSLAITAGGSVSASALTVGNTSSGVGDLSVSGTASVLSLGTQIVVGAAGIGDVAISNGATISAASGTIGLSAGSSGVVDIEGANSRLSLSGDLDIGETGTGVLIMGVGNTTLSVEGNLNIGTSGQLAQFGGVIDPANFTNHGTVGGAGTLDVAGTLTNDGVYYAQGGTYEMNVGTLITGPGTLVVNDGGNLVVNAGSVADIQQVSFNNDTVAAVLTIGTLATFGAVIDNFNTLDSIVLTGTTIGSDAYTAGSSGANGVLTLYAGPDQSGSVIGTLAVSSSISGSDLTTLEMVNNGTVGEAPCFAAGTRIATERGKVAVEELRPGDLVRVAGSGEDFAPVVWVGQRHVVCGRHPKPRLVWPVRVAAGAFGPGRPGRDLWLSPDHALFLEGVLIPVKYLIDGVAIVQVACAEITYYHVELPRHAVLLAEGLAAESYLDTGDRGNFANGGGAVALYPDFATLHWEAEGCAPLVVTGPEVETARAILVERWGQTAQTERICALFG